MHSSTTLKESTYYFHELTKVTVLRVSVFKVATLDIYTKLHLYKMKAHFLRFQQETHCNYTFLIKTNGQFGGGGKKNKAQKAILRMTHLLNQSQS